MHNSVILFIVPVFDRIYPFCANLVQKLKLVCWKCNLISNSNIVNLMVVFILSGLDWKYSFWANLVQKIKIVSLSWNLVLGLTRIRKFQWWWSFFLFSTKSILFFGNMFLKNKIICWIWNLEPTITHKILETNSSFYVE